MIMTGFINYCEEDNPKLAEAIKTYLADYFDLPNRTIKLDTYEYEWIEKNLSLKHKREIFGYAIIEDGYPHLF